MFNGTEVLWLWREVHDSEDFLILFPSFQFLGNLKWVFEKCLALFPSWKVV